MGRPAVVPPAGRGRGMDARPCRGAGGEGGALSPKSAEGGRGPRRLDPYREVGCPGGPRRRMEAPTVPMFVPAVALDHSDHALSEAKKRAN